MDSSIINELKSCKETLWLNPDLKAVTPYSEINGKKFIHVKAAQNRLMRFMPYIEAAFPETAPRKGIIESQLIEIPQVKEMCFGNVLPSNARLFLKDDAHLPIAGSVKARGGIHEVLKVAEDLALREGLISPTDSRLLLNSAEAVDFFSKYTIQVGSTGNLGLSIGLMSARLGFKVIVHMSSDARQWKKDMLRRCGVDVREYDDDYSQAVAQGRKMSDADPSSHFVDDEASEDLFFGYATAALRLRVQLSKLGISVDEAHPLFVYLPCGVGGAPGGITFGLKQLFGSNVHCFFAEPTHAPCFTLSMSSGKNNDICVYDIGLDGRTEADGLAVGRASGFVCSMMKPLVSGSFTVSDEKMLSYQRRFKELSGIYLEPSACAGFAGPHMLFDTDSGRKYPERIADPAHIADATHIIWATGGGLVPEELR